MGVAISPLPQYVFMAWCLVKAQGQLYLLPLQLNLAAESCTICSSRSRRPVRKLLDTRSYVILD